MSVLTYNVKPKAVINKETKKKKKTYSAPNHKVLATAVKNKDKGRLLG